MDPMLEQPKGRVAGIAPRQAIALKNIIRPWTGGRNVTDSSRSAVVQLFWKQIPAPARQDLLRIAAVVGQKQDERVFFLTAFFQRFEEPAAALIHAIDLAGVDRHAQI